MSKTKTLYETNWHYVEEDFSHCSVTPIMVVRHEVEIPEELI